MHQLSFQCKRAHLAAVAFGRRIFEGTKAPDDPDFDGVKDMTPARFDILFLVHGQFSREWRFMEGSLAMTTLRRRLGLSRATISKAVKRLIELGLLTAEQLDGRSKVVRLTKEGFARIRHAMHLVFSGRVLARHYRHFFADYIVAPGARLAARIDFALHEAWWRLFLMGRHLGDTSDIVYLARNCHLEL